MSIDFSRYIAVDSKQIVNRIADSEYYLVSVKHDGHLAFLHISQGKALLCNRSGEQLDVPEIINSASKISHDCIIAGELCCFKDEQSTTHREVSSALSNPKEYDLRFGAFDILSLNGNPIASSPEEKAALLKGLVPGKAIFAIEQKYYTSRNEIVSFYNEVASQVEGVVVRSANGFIYKIKETLTFDLVVLGFAVSTGERSGWLREMLLGFALGNNRFQVVAKCGGGFSDNERQELPKQLENISTKSEYTEVSGAKTAFIMVKPEMVVEITCLDIINESAGTAIKKVVLEYHDNDGYRNRGSHPTLSIISPNFIRVRNDKKPTESDTGTLQAYTILQPFETMAADEVLQNSSVIVREVFVKPGKGGTSVRKFVGLKTNKESTSLYPSFLVIYTDFSGGRKSPLDQELFICASELEVIDRINSLKEENIKKGWEIVN